jgi:hypothetical protein
MVIAVVPSDEAERVAAGHRDHRCVAHAVHDGWSLNDCKGAGSGHATWECVARDEDGRG